MISLSIDEAQLKLHDVVHGLTPGDEVLIVENDRPVAQVTAGGLDAAANASRARHDARHGPLYGS